VLVKPIEQEAKETEYGLLLPQTEEKEQKAQGTVEAIGEEVNGLKVGDRVIYGAFAGENIKTREGGKEVDYKLLHDDDVIAFIK